MPKDKEIESFNIREVGSIECCDCGLVHEVSYDIYEDGTVIMHFSREEERTAKARIARAGGKSKLYCRQLDEARARENLHPPETPDAVKTEASSIGAILGKGEKWRPQLQK